MITEFVLMSLNSKFVSILLPDPHIYLFFSASVPRIFLFSREAISISPTMLVSFSDSKIAGLLVRNCGVVF